MITIERMIEAALASELRWHTRRHRTTLWGQPHIIKPALVSEIFGDGLQLIWFSPLATRPDHYVVRIGSDIQMDNCADPKDGPVFCDEVLDDLQNAIESEFDSHHEEWEHDNGRTYVKHHPFPALDDSCGCAWGTIHNLKEIAQGRKHGLRE